MTSHSTRRLAHHLRDSSGPSQTPSRRTAVSFLSQVVIVGVPVVGLIGSPDAGGRTCDNSVADCVGASRRWMKPVEAPVAPLS